MWIVSLPRGNRAAAISLARKVFEENVSASVAQSGIWRGSGLISAPNGYTRFCSTWKPAAGADTPDEQSVGFKKDLRGELAQAHPSRSQLLLPWLGPRST